MSVIGQYSTSDATVIVGTVIDDSLEGSLRVTIVATGIDSNSSSIEFKLLAQFHIPENNSNNDVQKFQKLI